MYINTYGTHCNLLCVVVNGVVVIVCCVCVQVFVCMYLCVWQAEEGHVSPMSGRRKRERMEASPMTCYYYLRSSQACTCWQATVIGTGMRLATSPAIGTATSIGLRHDVAHKGFIGVENSSTRAGRQTAREGEQKSAYKEL